MPVHLLYANIPAESLSYSPTFFLKGGGGERYVADVSMCLRVGQHIGSKWLSG